MDVDPLDIGVRPVVEREHEIDDPRRGIAIGMRAHVDERKAALAGREHERIGGLVHRLAVEHFARRKPHHAAHRRGVERCDARRDVDRAEPVALALVDREGDDETLLGRIVGAGAEMCASANPFLM